MNRIQGMRATQEKLGNAMQNRPRPTKAGEALLGWLQPKLSQLEAKYNLPTGLLRSVAITESGGNQFAVSRAGAMGLFQFMPQHPVRFMLACTAAVRQISRRPSGVRLRRVLI